MDTENDFENNYILRIYIYVFDDFLDFLSSKQIFKSNSVSINKKNLIRYQMFIIEENVAFC